MRFTIRDIALIIVIVAVSVGWWADRSKLQRDVVEAKEQVVRTEFVLRELMKTMDVKHPGWRGAGWAEVPE